MDIGIADDSMHAVCCCCSRTRTEEFLIPSLQNKVLSLKSYSSLTHLRNTRFASLSFSLSYSPTCGPRLLCTLLDVKKLDRRDSSVFDSACLRFAYQSFLMSKAHLNLRYSFLSSSVKTETAS